MLNELNEAGKSAGIKINFPKTKIMYNTHISDTNETIKIDNTPIQETDEFIYLGQAIKWTRQ